MPVPIRPIPLLVTAQALLMAGCGGTRPAAVAPESGGPACSVVSMTGVDTVDAVRPGPSEVVNVALRDRVDASHAPMARNSSERMVFRQLYQTLVQVDCEDRVRPGLATSWSHDGAGRRWTFTLRSDARFWDGTPVRALAVAQGWASSHAVTDASTGSGLIDSVRVLGERELQVFLHRPETDAAGFARSELSVIGPGSYAGWKLGSGPYRPTVAPGGLEAQIRVVASRPADGTGTIVFRIPDDTDARGALDAGADLLVSYDPEVLAYAAALPGFVIVPLPWSRTYVVAAGGSGGEESPSSPIPADALERLARGAVRADARPAEPPFWWQREGCRRSVETAVDPNESSSRAPSSDGGATRIVYPTGDAVARALAERLVALAGLGSAKPPWLTRVLPGLRAVSGSPVAAGLDPVSLALVARRGEALAMVMPVSRAPSGACPRAALGVDADLVASVFSLGGRWSVTPLVDVRPSLVARRGIAGIGIDGTGTLVFHPGGDGR